MVERRKTMKSLDNRYIGLELSTATMRSEDLIPSFMGFLKNVAEECEIQEESSRLKAEVEKLEFEDHPGYGTYYKDKEQASWILNEDIWNLLNDIAPDYTYFGANEGDGACYGFWTVDEALSDHIEAELHNAINGQDYILDFDQIRKTCEHVLEILNQHDR